MAGVTLAEAIREARAALISSPTADLDARLLVEHFTGTSRADAITGPGREVRPDRVAALRAALARRGAGEPVHRIIGWREFYGLRLVMSSETLEPRPDTETLVDAMVERLRWVKAGGRCRILDLGTGTGAIGLALLSQLPGATVVATDISAQALSTAAANAAALGLAPRFSTLASDWFSAVAGRFHGIVSNPPYIRSTDYEALDRSVKDFDPVRALVGGEDGLDAYRKIAARAGRHLEPGGFVGVETGFDQREDVTAIFADQGFALVEARNDLGGNHRVLVFDR